MTQSFARNRARGFTIVELLIVIVIIGILAALSFVTYNGVQANARDKAVISDVDGVEAELARYAVKNDGTYGTELAWDSTAGSNAKIQFTPSKGNVIIVTTTQSSYCIKSYNPSSATYKSLTTAYKKGSDSTSCSPGWLMIASGNRFNCAIASNNLAYCWGGNYWGSLGNGANLYSDTSVADPVAVNTTGVLSGKTMKSITAGNYHSCAIASDDLAYCWGTNTDGQLGNGTKIDSSSPVAVDTSGVLSGKTIISIAAGYDDTCVVASDYKAYCWGRNTAGSLGNNSVGGSTVPVAVNTAGVLSGKSLKSISIGYGFSCAVSSDGRVFCWGGRLQNTTNSDSSVPVAVSMSGVLAGKTVESVSAWQDHACLKTSDNQIYCWGNNIKGQLGNNSTANSNLPTGVDMTGVLSGKAIRSVATGYWQTVVITTDGKLYSWGGSDPSRTSAYTSVPVAVNAAGALSGKTIRAVSAGNHQACAIASDNQAYCWVYLVSDPTLVNMPSI